LKKQFAVVPLSGYHIAQIDARRPILLWVVTCIVVSEEHVGKNR
jgi:hypothetical protein